MALLSAPDRIRCAQQVSVIAISTSLRFPPRSDVKAVRNQFHGFSSFPLLCPLPLSTVVPESLQGTMCDREYKFCSSADPWKVKKSGRFACNHLPTPLSSTLTSTRSTTAERARASAVPWSAVRAISFAHRGGNGKQDGDRMCSQQPPARNSRFISR